MKTVSLSEAKDRLSGLVDEAESTHEIVTITKHGRPAAVLMAAEDLESLHETLYWLSRSDFREDMDAAATDEQSGNTITTEELRARLRATAQ
jgi:prevent-host-death family protein